MIEIENLRKVYKSKHSKTVALADISIKLPSRGLVAMYGENGCGKTTLLNILSTVDHDYEGQVTYNGINYRDMEKELRRDIVSVILQENHFVDYLDIEENIQITQKSENECNNLLTQYGLGDKKNSYSDELSGGQKQRANVVRGLLKDFAVLLVDEPTSSMNSEMEKEVFESLRKIAENKLVVLVSHNIVLIRKYSDFIIHMDNGNIVSMEKNCALPVKYVDNVVKIPYDFVNLSLLDEQYVLDTLQKQKRLVIEVNEECETSNNHSFYETVETPKNKPRTLLKQYWKNLLKKSILSQKMTFALGAVLLSVLVALLGIITLLCNADQTTIRYSCLKNNISGDVLYDREHVLNERKEYFDYNSYKTMRDEYGMSISLLEIFDSEMCVDIAESGQRLCSFYGVVLYDNNPELMLGKYPDKDEILITDYTAFQLTSWKNLYKSEQDIIEKGIIINNKKVTVSGIVKTDYYENGSSSDPVKKASYQKNKETIYRCFYYPLDSYEKLDGIYNYYNAYTNCIADYIIYNNETVIQDNSDIINSSQIGSFAEAHIYINSYMRSLLDDDYLLLSIQDVYCAVVGVVESDEEYPIVYMSENDLNTMRNRHLRYPDGILFKTYSKDDIKLLEHYTLKHNTAVSEIIENAEEIIIAMGYMIRYAQLLFLSIIVIAMLVFVNNQYRHDNKLIFWMRMNGYSDFSMLKFEIGKGLILLITTIVLTIAFMFGFMKMLNTGFSKYLGCSINLFSGEKKEMIMTSVLLLVIFAVMEICIGEKYKRKNLGKLLK